MTNNQSGPEGVVYRHTGGRPHFAQEQVEALVTTVVETEPADPDIPGHNWTLRKIRKWLKSVMGCDWYRTTLYHLLKEQGLSWKKGQKMLKKADPVKRAAFVERFNDLFEQVHREEIRLVYIDEAHIHRDMDLGYTWAVKGEVAWRASHCPPLSDRINWYGAYDFSLGQCFIWNEGGCNQDRTVQFLRHLSDWLGDDSLPVVTIGDGAPWHRAKRVQSAAAALGFTLVPLPGYSPDLNPIEGLWKWMRDEVTKNHCHATRRHLFEACIAFIERINADPDALISRLWPKFDLDPDYGKTLGFKLNLL